MASPGDKIAKIIGRLQARIAEGQYYEAQQQTRVVATRYIKSQNWPAAVDILYSVSDALLAAQQGACAGDLCIMLVDVYSQAKLAPDADSRGKLLHCLRRFAPEEPTRKKLISVIISWSAKFGPYPAGDPELHHAIGNIFAQEHAPYEAEHHFIYGTKESPEKLAQLEYKWFSEGNSPHLAAQFAARALFPYLILSNLRAANTFYKTFTDLLIRDNAGLPVEEVQMGVRVFPSIPLLNFLGGLLVTIPRRDAESYRRLVARYTLQLKENGGSWGESLEVIGEQYFGIPRPRQSNPLLDMMGGLFGGGGGGFGGKRPIAGGRSPAPTAEGLD